MQNYDNNMNVSNSNDNTYSYDTHSYDNYDLKILKLLHQNSRISVKDISEHIHLSQPTCAERVKKLEAKGIIQHYTTVINWQALGYNLSTIIRISPLPGHLQNVEDCIKVLDNVEWCYKGTGDDSFICKMWLKSTVAELDDYLEDILKIARTSTSVIKVPIVENRFLALKKK